MLAITFSSSYASHIPGANISYRCIGPNTYEVTLWTVFRCPVNNLYTAYMRIHNDCNLTNPSNYTTTTVGTTPSQWRMDTIQGLTNIDKSQICQRQITQSICQGGTIPGVNVTTYIDTVTLPATCNAWTFSWSSCCRDNTTNLVGQPGIYVETKMYSGSFPCDNSPYINAQPIPYACANQNINYNLNVVDPDGDSLVFSLIAARSAVATNVPYSGAFSAVQPILGMIINPQTGVLSFNAPAGNYVTCVKVESFDRATGLIKCEMIYDFQIIVIACTNQTPQNPVGGVSNVTGSGTRQDSTTVEVCEGGQLCFDLVFTDQDPGDTLYLNQENATTQLPGATVVATGLNPLTVRVCWTAPPGSAGSYPVSVTVDDGACPILAITNAGVNVVVTPGLSVNLGNDTNLQCGQTMNITANVSGGTGNYTYVWGPGGQTTQTLTGVGAGTYWVDVQDTASQACIGSDTIVVTSGIPPTAHFTWVAGCPGSGTNFTDSSWTTVGGITGWAWDIGNNNSVDYTTQNPSHTFPAGGPYQVKLVATNTAGCQDSVVLTVNVPYIPVADFTFDTVCTGNQTCFTDLSNVTGSAITGWQWVFGDGSPVNNTQNPCHTYALPGTYNVTLIVTSADGCTQTVVKTVTVNDIPTAAAIVNNMCEYDIVTFTDNSNIAVGAITSWQWDVNGDLIDDYFTQNAGHLYATPGTYNWRLIVGSGVGCTDTATGTVDVHPAPVANFNFTNVCDGNAMPFTDQSNITAGNIVNWNWTYGDGTNGNVQNPTHMYPNDNTYNVCLIVTSDQGCVDTVCQNVDVYALPVVNYSVPDICEGNPSQFTDNSTVNGGTIGSWTWNYGDGSPLGAGATSTHPYGQYGTYNTKLIVVSNNGCVDSATVVHTVDPNPVVAFSPDNADGCAPVCVNFTNNSNIPVGTISSWNWNLGDGNSSTANAPSHCYENALQSPQSFDVTLTATSDKGCVTTVTQNALITVYPIPVASFSWEPDNPKILTAPEVNFLNTSIGAATNNWNLGDGTTSTAFSPTHTYKDTGTHYVYLQIENQWGCRDSTWKYIRIEPEFAIFIPNSFTPGSDATNDLWAPKGFGMKEMDLYIYDRWGERIWEGHGLDAKWDGKVNGKTAKTEVYVYRVDVVTANNEEKTYHGKVTLLK